MEIEKYIVFGKINAILKVDYSAILFDENIYFVKIKNRYENITVEKYIFQKTSCGKKRMLDSLKMVHLEEDVLVKKMNVLSSTEKLKIEFAVLLILNVKCIVFASFEQFFMEKELFYFKKLVKKLVKKYQKTFVFLNGDISFLFEFADRLVVGKNKKDVLVIDNPTFYEEELYALVEKPPIVDFVKYLNAKGKKILPYTDLKELLKAIFREV